MLLGGMPDGDVLGDCAVEAEGAKVRPPGRRHVCTDGARVMAGSWVHGRMLG